MEFFYIFIVAFIQGGGYDFAGWYGILKEQSGHRLEWLYRLAKETLDFIATPLILIFIFHWNENLIGAFYLLKWSGWCDGFYIAMWKLFNPGKSYTEDGIWWMWWTPLGMKRSQIIYSADLSTFEPNEIMRLFGKWYLLKGKLSLKEFYIQLAAGLIASYLAYHFEVVSIVWNLFN